MSKETKKQQNENNNVNENILQRIKVEKNLINILISLFGIPTWLSNPEQVNPDKVLDMWAEEFNHHKPEHLKKACYRYYMDNKKGRFPSLHHIGAYVNEIKEKETPLMERITESLEKRV